MQYYDSQNDYSIETNKWTIDTFMEKIDYVRELGIFGGEPFIYCNGLSELIKHIGSAAYTKKIGVISINTNGTILPDSTTLETMRDFAVHLSISDYGFNADKVSRLISVLKEYNRPVPELKNNAMIV